MKKLALIILDGFGVNTKTPEENAIILAKSPIVDTLFKKLTTRLAASGKAVGLPDGQIGSSEVGHMTIGMGRVKKQYLVAINDLLNDGEFAQIPEFMAGIEHCKKNNSNLHLIQLFGPGGVHAYDEHLKKILALIPKDINIYLHLFGDGRDLDPKSALDLMQEFSIFLEKFPNVKISSLAGRYYGMDRDNNRERIQKAYDEIMFGQLQTSDTPSEYIAKQYEQEITDEFFKPVSFTRGEQIESDDAVFHLNFRSDRGKQLSQAIMGSLDASVVRTYPNRPTSGFMLKKLTNVYFATMTKYYGEYTGHFFIKDPEIKNTLGEVLAQHELRQLRIAETEKFAHTTRFFNGDKNIVYDGERDILIPSHKVPTFDLDPEMSVQEIYDTLLMNFKDFDVAIVNFANGDIVGHTGVLDATVKAMKKIGDILEHLVARCKTNGYDLILTADHGNCEQMGTSDHPDTAHTLNLVPFRYIKDGEVIPTKPTGGLADVAPTILSIMGIKIPQEMTGKSLI